MKAEAIRFISTRLPQKMLGPVTVALVIFYLVFQVLSGDYGVYALLRNQRELEILKADLTNVQAQNKELGLRVKHMSDRSLDLDMLDEQSRKILGDAGENEQVIPLNKTTAP